MRHASKTVLALVALVAALALAACGGSDDNGGKPAGDGNATAPSSGKTAKGAGAESKGGDVPTVVVRDGEPVGGIEELEYSAGDQVSFRVESDVADEVHVHGYDLMEDVPAGGSVSFDFPAEIEGIFEVELEGRKEQIAELRVNP
jgi:hypothetical protein